MLHHNQNNSSNLITGQKRKAIGVVSGVPDLELILSLGRIAFFELKTDKGVQSEAQKEFMKKIMAREHFYFIIRSLEQFQKIVKQLYE
jgi:hypothetical protein